MVGVQQLMGFVGQRRFQIGLVEAGDVPVVMGKADLRFGVEEIQGLAPLEGQMGWPPPPTQPPGQAMTSTKS